MNELVEVRVLGPFRVRTASGDVVPASAWRTSKTRNLVRLLATSAGDVVPVDVVVEALWPDVPPERGRASLRTAISQVRHVIGDEHVVRRSGGLALTRVWVDARAFESQAELVRHHASAGDLAGVVTNVWEAMSLYGGDLCGDEPYAEWAGPERDRLRQLGRDLLLEGAEAACGLGWLRDAVELGHRALRLEPSSERAYRVLMRTYWKLGETEQALGLFERCRRTLAEELGADPGHETQALHLELLRPPPEPAASPAFIGREHATAVLARATTAVLDELRPASVLVTGPAGSGRTRLAEEVLHTWPHRSVSVRCRSTTRAQGGLLRAVADAMGVALEEPDSDDLRRLLTESALLLVLDDVDAADPDGVSWLARLLHAEQAPLLVVATAGPDASATVTSLLRVPLCEHVSLPPLPSDEVAQLLESVLGGSAAAALVDEVAAVPTPAAVVAHARDLARTGELLSTAEGMLRVPRQYGRPPGEADATLALARSQVPAVGSEALDLLAVLDRWTSLDELARLARCGLDELRSCLADLGDLGAVAHDVRGYRLRDPVMRQAAYRWLRSSIRRRLHRTVAMNARLDAAARVEHWVQCGEPALACAAGLEAADDALLRGDHAQVRRHLLRVLGFAEEQSTDVEERVSLAEQLADAAERLDRVDEARERLEKAVGLAQFAAPHTLVRLHARLARLEKTADDAAARYDLAAALPGVDDHDLRRIGLAAAATALSRGPEAATEKLQLAVLEADAADDVEAQVESRVLLARAAGQHRGFEVAEQAAKEALALAEAARSTTLFARAAHALVQTPSYLGRGAHELPLLRRALAAAVASGDVGLTTDVHLTYCFVLHELGSPDFAREWSKAGTLPHAGGRGTVHAVLDAVVSLERGHLQRAARLLDQLPPRLDAVLADHAAQIARARLQAHDGDAAGGAQALQAVVDDPRVERSALLLPEAEARLAELLSRTSPESARHHLAGAVTTAGAQPYPREQVCVLRARASLLAVSGDGPAAATVALAAALSAAQAGLVLHEAEAYALRAEIQEALGGPCRGARDRALAAACFRRGGAPLRAAAQEARGVELSRPPSALTSGTA